MKAKNENKSRNFLIKIKYFVVVIVFTVTKFIIKFFLLLCLVFKFQMYLKSYRLVLVFEIYIRLMELFIFNGI